MSIKMKELVEIKIGKINFYNFKKCCKKCFKFEILFEKNRNCAAKRKKIEM